MSKQYSYRDDFERIYLRHDILDKCKDLNPKYIVEFKNIIEITSKLIYSRFLNSYNRVNFDYDDVLSIANLYALYYMNLYSTRDNAELRQKMIQKYTDRHHKKPSDAKIHMCDRNNLIRFLRQRLRYLAILCDRKGKNILPQSSKEGYFIPLENAKIVSKYLIMEDPEKYGYKKIRIQDYLEAQRYSKQMGFSDIQTKDGSTVFVIENKDRPFSHKDYLSVFAQSQNEYTNNPEHHLINLQSQKEKAEKNKTKLLRSKFKLTSDSDKLTVLTQFINQHKNDSRLYKELKLARKWVSKIQGNNVSIV